LAYLIPGKVSLRPVKIGSVAYRLHAAAPYCIRSAFFFVIPHIFVTSSPDRGYFFMCGSTYK
jgi:hypothetical protein